MSSKNAFCDVTKFLITSFSYSGIVWQKLKRGQGECDIIEKDPKLTWETKKLQREFTPTFIFFEYFPKILFRECLYITKRLIWNN